MKSIWKILGLQCCLLSILCAADADGDGLDDQAEIQTYKTDPNQWDTDHDGISDGTEIAVGRDPLKNETGLYLYSFPNAQSFGGTFRSVAPDSASAGALRLVRSGRIQERLFVPCTGRGTILVINTSTAEIVGEYFSAPEGRGRQPSALTVDLDGNAWIGNRAESSGGQGSVVRIGVVRGGTRGRKEANGSFTPDPQGAYLKGPFDYSTAIDRDGDGLIRTSRGLGVTLPWTGVDPEDECITLYRRVPATQVSGLAVDRDNGIWIIGAGNRYLTCLSSETGIEIPGTGTTVEKGGNGLVVDLLGRLWIMDGVQNSILRYDPTIGNRSFLESLNPTSLTLDSTTGMIWHTRQNGFIQQIDATTLAKGNVEHGGSGGNGILVNADQVWVSHVEGGRTVGHILTNGTVLGTVALPPKGATQAQANAIAVDSSGKIWVVCQGTEQVLRINPDLGSLGLGGVPLGQVDRVIDLGDGAAPQAVGDLTGAAANRLFELNGGSWNQVIDGGLAGRVWKGTSWQAEIPGSSQLDVAIRTADDLTTLALKEFTLTPSKRILSGLTGRYAEIRVRLIPKDGQSPRLLSLAVFVDNPVPANVQADSDKDGLVDALETLVFHTDTMSSDTDHDGISDLDEITHGLDPLVPSTGIFSLTYTLDRDFDLGTNFAVNHNAPNNNQLQLSRTGKLFPFAFFPCSNRGTIVCVDVNTGKITGEFWSSPSGRARNPSRTVVDQLGNVWVGNRDEASAVSGTAMGSVIKIGIVIGGVRGNKLSDGSFVPDPKGQYLRGPFDYCTAVDRDGDGLIKTSTGIGNVLPWANTNGADNFGGVSTADDERVLAYTRTYGICNRSIAVDENNDVWVGGMNFTATNNRTHQKINGTTGLIVNGTSFNLTVGGYGAVIDKNGYLFSAGYDRNSFRYDTKMSSSDSNAFRQFSTGFGNYGITLDVQTGYIWHVNSQNWYVYRYDPVTLGATAFGHGLNYAQGVAASDGHVWVAHTAWADIRHVGHLTTNGTFIGNTPLPQFKNRFAGATGVAVDGNGKIWVACYNSHAAMRIDKTKGAIGGGGLPIGEVDLIVDLNEGYNEAVAANLAYPYNYSDMTGLLSSKLFEQNGGWWSVVTDGQQNARAWTTVTWNGRTLDATKLTVSVRAADDKTVLATKAWKTMFNGERLTDVVGRYIETKVRFLPDTVRDLSPILYDLTVVSVGANGSGPIVLAKNVTVSTEPGLPHTTVAPSAVDAGSFDPDGGPLALKLDPPAPYNAGKTPVTLRATDAEGLVGSASATITVVDKESPVVLPPLNVVMATDPGQPTASSDRLIPARANDNVGVTAILSDAPNRLPLGTTIVTWYARDAAGNMGSATQAILVKDMEAPVIVVQSPLRISAPVTAIPIPATAAKVQASDNVAVISLERQGPDQFPLGTSTVLWTARDAAGNTATQSQIVMVEELPPVDHRIQWITPAAGTVFPKDGRCSLTVEVVDVDHHAIKAVHFQVNGQEVATDSEAPYTALWTAMTPGTYTLTASIEFRFDTKIVRSEERTITVTAP